MTRRQKLTREKLLELDRQCLSAEEAELSDRPYQYKLIRALIDHAIATEFTDARDGMRYLGEGTYRVGPLRGQRMRSPITGRFKKGQSPDRGEDGT